MKRYKRFISASKYIDSESHDVIFDDRIVIDIEIDAPRSIITSSNQIIVKFPGVDQFKQDALDILENEYKFIVIEDIYDGKLQKGYISNKDDSISVYFDTYFDFSNAQHVLRRMNVRSVNVPEKGQVYCFIHMRFSDHVLNDDGDSLHRKFIAENADKYTRNNPNITHVIKEDNIYLREEEVQLYYDEALEDLRDQLDSRILYWIKKVDRFKQ